MHLLLVTAIATVNVILWPFLLLFVFNNLQKENSSEDMSQLWNQDHFVTIINFLSLVPHTQLDSPRTSWANCWLPESQPKPKSFWDHCQTCFSIPCTKPTSQWRHAPTIGDANCSRSRGNFLDILKRVLWNFEQNGVRLENMHQLLVSTIATQLKTIFGPFQNTYSWYLHTRRQSSWRHTPTISDNRIPQNCGRFLAIKI